MKSIAKLILLMLLVATLTETGMINIHDEDFKGEEDTPSKGVFPTSSGKSVSLSSSTGQSGISPSSKGGFSKT